MKLSGFTKFPVQRKNMKEIRLKSAARFGNRRFLLSINHVPWWRVVLCPLDLLLFDSKHAVLENG
jgi:hypothetical protein